MRTLCCLLVMATAASLATSHIVPKTAERRVNGAVNITCNAPVDVAVDQCIFKVWLEAGSDPDDTQPMDLSRGAASITFRRASQSNAHLFDGDYLGAGLERGECGVRLSALTEGRYFVGCRVRVRGGGWTYEFMALVVDKDAEPSTASATDAWFVNATVDAGGASAALSFATVGGTLQECRLWLPERAAAIALTAARPAAGAAAAGYQATLAGGRCSVTLLGVGQRASGVVWAAYKTLGKDGWRWPPPQLLNVGVAPQPADLTVTPETVLTSDPAPTAVCSVGGARPVPRIRWLVDGAVVREDSAHDPAPDGADAAWAWPWYVQALRQQVQVDVGTAGVKVVKCLVFHPDLGELVEEKTAEVHVTEPLVPATAAPTAPTTAGGAGTVGPTKGDGGDDDAGDDDAGLTWLWVLLGVLAAAAAVGGAAYYFKSSRPAGQPPPKQADPESVDPEPVKPEPVKAEPVMLEPAKQFDEIPLLRHEQAPRPASRSPAGPKPVLEVDKTTSS